MKFEKAKELMLDGKDCIYGNHIYTIFVENDINILKRRPLEYVMNGAIWENHDLAFQDYESNLWKIYDYANTLSSEIFHLKNHVKEVVHANAIRTSLRELKVNIWLHPNISIDKQIIIEMLDDKFGSKL